MKATSRAHDQEILDSLLDAYPGFLCENLDWRPGPDPRISSLHLCLGKSSDSNSLNG
jgi:hypothetical protein